MAVPFYGSVNTFGTLTEGWGNAGNWIAGGLLSIRRFSLSIPSFYELLPRYSNCCILGRPFEKNRTPYDPIDVVKWNYLNWVPGSITTEQSRKGLANALSAAKKIRDLTLKPYPNSVIVSYLVGSSIETRAQYYAVRGASTVTEYRFRSGDGTVIEGSASAGDTTRAFVSMAQHMKIFDDNAARETLRRLLNDVESPFPKYFGPKEYNVVTNSGKTVTVKSVAFAPHPNVVVAGQQTSLELRVIGDAESEMNDLRLRASVTDDIGAESVLVYSSTLDFSLPKALVGIYKVIIKAPDRVGTLTVTFDIHGLPTLDEQLIVLPHR
ncbi:hypothetical protein B0G76_7474 [Paraburkholderia sp. BL23I1N1]|nr:hypothetical protein B0G76_7474 [Paraburkholderia sp. BL23I1N1]